MKKALWAAAAAALVVAAAPAMAKEKKADDKDAAKVAAAIASIAAPKDAPKAVALTWPAGVIAGTPTVAAVGGIATFNNLRLNKTGSGYVLHAAAGALSTNSAGAGFTVTPGGVSASLSTVSAAPGSITASSGASQATITVTARDTLANLIPGATVVFSATNTGNAR